MYPRLKCHVKWAFNNYVDKRGVVESPRGQMTNGRLIVCTIAIFVHSGGVEGQNLIKFGPRTC